MHVLSADPVFVHQRQTNLASLLHILFSYFNLLILFCWNTDSFSFKLIFWVPTLFQHIPDSRLLNLISIFLYYFSATWSLLIGRTESAWSLLVAMVRFFCGLILIFLFVVCILSACMLLLMLLFRLLSASSSLTTSYDPAAGDFCFLGGEREATVFSYFCERRRPRDTADSVGLW